MTKNQSRVWDFDKIIFFSKWNFLDKIIHDSYKSYFHRNYRSESTYARVKFVSKWPWFPNFWKSIASVKGKLCCGFVFGNLGSAFFSFEIFGWSLENLPNQFKFNGLWASRSSRQRPKILKEIIELLFSHIFYRPRQLNFSLRFEFNQNFH